MPEVDLERLLREERVDTVVFAYSDVTHETVMHAASRALAGGADFELLGPRRTMLPSTRPVVATGATRTGAGKSQTTRYLARLIEAAGLKPVVVRHPMPYGDLVAQRVPAIRQPTPTSTATTRRSRSARSTSRTSMRGGSSTPASTTARSSGLPRQRRDVIVWDGGNNDFPFYRPDLFVVVADPLRAGHETRYHPGETNLRLADVVVINKIDSAAPEAIAQVRASIAAANPSAAVVEARSALTLVGGAIEGRTVAVVEDGPTLTHGGMSYGAGIVAARRFGARAIIDPRPYASGSLKATLDKYPDLDALLPAMGYGATQVHELEATLNTIPADIVLCATPIDLTRILHLDKPVVRVRYELEEVSGPSLASLLEPILVRAGRSAAKA